HRDRRRGDDRGAGQAGARGAVEGRRDRGRVRDRARVEDRGRAGDRERARQAGRNRTDDEVVSPEGEHLAAMAQFRIPGPLRRLSDGQVTVPVEASDLASAIEALDARYPGFRDRLLDENGQLRQFVNVYLNDEDVRLGSGLQAKGHGWVLLEVSGEREELDRGVAFLESKGVKVEPAEGDLVE